MRRLGSSDYLDLWERGFGLHPLDQGLLVLGAGEPEATYQSLADWPLGRRNRVLAEMRFAGFGPRLQGWAACAQCGEKLEFEMDGRTIANQSSGAVENNGEFISVNGLSYRLPTTRDLAGVAAERDSLRAAIGIIEACCLDAGEIRDWSEEDLDEVGKRMARADPLAEILIDLRCPACGNRASEVLDIASFFWAEIEAQAKRLLMEIHTLASAYGWTEREVLSLSDQRRRFYVEMVHG